MATIARHLETALVEAYAYGKSNMTLEGLRHESDIFDELTQGELDRFMSQVSTGFRCLACGRINDTSDPQCSDCGVD